MSNFSPSREQARLIWQAAVNAVDPLELIGTSLERPEPMLAAAFVRADRILLVGGGKAGAAMAAGVEAAPPAQQPVRSASSIISFLRRGTHTNEVILVVGNFTPVPRLEHPVGVPFGGFWEEMLNSDASIYGGSGVGNSGGVLATATPCHDQPYSLSLAVPPLAVVFLKGAAPTDAAVPPSRLLGK